MTEENNTDTGSIDNGASDTGSVNKRLEKCSDIQDISASENPSSHPAVRDTSSNTEVAISNAVVKTLPQNNELSTVSASTIAEPPKKPRRLWRFVRSLSLPFVIGGIGFLAFILLGQQGLTGLNHWLSAHWSTLTLIRFGIYGFICFIVSPAILNRVKQQKLQQLDELYQQLTENPNIPVQQLWELEAQMRKVSHAKLPRWLIPIILLLIEIIFVQLPFLLK